MIDTVFATVKKTTQKLYFGHFLEIFIFSDLLGLLLRKCISIKAILGKGRKIFMSWYGQCRVMIKNIDIGAGLSGLETVLCQELSEFFVPHFLHL